MQEILETQVPSLGRKDPREMATTPISLPGKFRGQRSLAGYIYGVTKSRTQLSSHVALYLLTTLPSPFPKLYKITESGTWFRKRISSVSLEIQITCIEIDQYSPRKVRSANSLSFFLVLHLLPWQRGGPRIQGQSSFWSWGTQRARKQ